MGEACASSCTPPATSPSSTACRGPCVRTPTSPATTSPLPRCGTRCTTCSNRSCPSPRSTARSCTQCRRPLSTASRRTLSAPTSTTGNQDLEKQSELAENLENGKDKGQQASLIRGLTGRRVFERESEKTEQRNAGATLP